MIDDRKPRLTLVPSGDEPARPRTPTLIGPAREAIDVRVRDLAAMLGAPDGAPSYTLRPDPDNPARMRLEIVVAFDPGPVNLIATAFHAAKEDA